MIFNLFKKSVPEKIPESMQLAVRDVSQSSSKQEAVARAYDIVTNKFRGYRLLTYLMVPELFTNTLDKVWAKGGRVHCTVLNYLIRILLVKSGHFKDEDISQRWTLVYYISPHQYLRVHISEDEYINVDAWGRHFGVPFGEYARGFKVSLFTRELG